MQFELESNTLTKLRGFFRLAMGLLLVFVRLLEMGCSVVDTMPLG